MEAQDGLPPGPRMARPIQTAIWSRQAQWMLSQCRRRLGPMFTLEIAYEGKWVIVSDPELVKEVFRGDPKVFHAGEGNQVLRPLLGEHSLLVLDEAPHMSQRKLLLPSRRWRSSCASWSPAGRSARPTRPQSATSAARSPRRRAATPRS